MMNWFELFGSTKQAHESVPKGQMVLVKADKFSICLAHTVDGFFAVSNHCTHLEAALHKGGLNSINEVICPWHAYRFCLRTGEERSGKGCAPLQTFSLKWEDGKLWIQLPLPLDD